MLNTSISKYRDNGDINLQYTKHVFWLVWFMVSNAPFNNILVTSWRSVLLAEETGVSGENHRPIANH